MDIDSSRNWGKQAMIITDIQDLFIELHKTESYSQIARRFGKNADGHLIESGLMSLQ